MTGKQKRITFVCVFAAIAVAESTAWNSWRQRVAWEKRQEELGIQNQAAAAKEAQDQQTKEREKAAAAQKETKEASDLAAATHTSYLARYINTSFSKTPGTRAIAVAVASEKGYPNQALNAAMVRHFNSAQIELHPEFFKPQFLSDRMFDDAFVNSSEVFKKLEIGNSLDALLLGRQSVRYSTNSTLANVVTATMELKVALVPMDAGNPGQTWSFTAAGSGFKEDDARSMAEDRLIKQIESDTKMSLQF